MKPKHVSWYNFQHVTYCEQTLVTLLHRLGPWKDDRSTGAGASELVIL
jgi:hypothetical protein